VSDVDELAAALRNADAHLDVDAADLSQTVEHARRRLLGRLLLVGTLSAVGAMLLITGGFRAAAIKPFSPRNTGNNASSQEATKHHHHHHGGNKGGGNGNGKNGNGEGGNKGGHGKHKKSHHHHPPPPPPPPPKKLPDIEVVSVSSTGFVVSNPSPVEVGTFFVRILIQEPETEQPHAQTYEIKPIAPESSIEEPFEKEVECVGEIRATADFEELIKESDEEDNEKTAKCTPPGEPEPEPEKENQKDGSGSAKEEGQKSKSASLVTPP
jgi:CARDB